MPAKPAKKNKDTKGEPNKDWFPWDIKAALANKGYSLARIAREYGYANRSPSQALRTPWAAVEQIIADIIGVPPYTIWPSRYDQKGHPLRSRDDLRIPKRKRVCNG